MSRRISGWMSDHPRSATAGLAAAARNWAATSDATSGRAVGVGFDTRTQADNTTKAKQVAAQSPKDLLRESRMLPIHIVEVDVQRASNVTQNARVAHDLARWLRCGRLNAAAQTSEPWSLQFAMPITNPSTDPSVKWITTSAVSSPSSEADHGLLVRPGARPRPRGVGTDGARSARPAGPVADAPGKDRPL